MTALGKWAEKGVPHKGRHCVSVEDLGAPDEICSMCETQEIRYVHYVQHADYVGDQLADSRKPESERALARHFRR